MATIEQTLARLRTLDVAAPKGIDELRKALKVDRPGSNLAVAKAAKLIADNQLHVLTRELVVAFEALLEDPAAKRDPNCVGKVAIARAFHDLDQWEERVLVRGLHVVQMEGWREPREDTAAELRGICGLAHAHFARPDALDVLAKLLADPWRLTRVAAATALGDAGRRDATALLRYSILAGHEREPDVLAAWS